MPRITLPTPLAILLMATSVAVLCFRPLSPVVPQIGLDASWIVVMGEAAERHLRWGLDLAFPYGPGSSLLTHYDSAIYLTRVLPMLVLLSLLFGWGAVLLIRSGQIERGRRGISLLAVLTMGVVLAGARGFPDVFFTALPLLPFLLALEPRATRQARVVSAGLAVAVGVAGLGKMSVLLCALPLFVLADLALMVRLRRWPILLPLLVLGFGAGALIFGQSLADLPAGLALQASVVAGYSEAMALDGSRAELALFSTASVALLAAGLWAERRGTADAMVDAFGPLRMLGVATVVALLFKAGFVRQDLHTLIAWNGLALTAVMTTLSRRRVWSGTLARTSLVAAVATVLLISPAIMLMQHPRDQRWADAGTLYSAWFVDEPSAQFRAAATAVASPTAYAEEIGDDKAAAWAKIVDLWPLPRLEGRVDTIPSYQSRIMASGLDYDPRPSFQEYATYTAALSEANRRFVEGPNAPDWILFGPEPGAGSLALDRRYPNTAEGALWPDLLRLYQPGLRIDDLLALRRREKPGATEMEPPQSVRARFNQPIDVPTAAATFVRIVVEPNILGRIAGLLFRPAPLVLTVRFADRHQASYQFVTGLGEAGFVLSPLVGTADDFRALAEGKLAPPDRAIVAFSIDATWKMQAFFAPEVAVELSALRIDPAETLASDTGP